MIHQRVREEVGECDLILKMETFLSEARQIDFQRQWWLFNSEDNISHDPTLLHNVIELCCVFGLFALRDPYWQKWHTVHWICLNTYSNIPYHHETTHGYIVPLLVYCTEHFMEVMSWTTCWEQWLTGVTAGLLTIGPSLRVVQHMASLKLKYHFF